MTERGKRWCRRVVLVGMGIDCAALMLALDWPEKALLLPVCFAAGAGSRALVNRWLD